MILKKEIALDHLNCIMGSIDPRQRTLLNNSYDFSNMVNNTAWHSRRLS